MKNKSTLSWLHSFINCGTKAVIVIKICKKKSFKNEDHSNADFSGSDLRGADFSGANCAGANFTNVKPGLTTGTAILIFFAALIVSILSGYFAMLTGRTIHLC